MTICQLDVDIFPKIVAQMQDLQDEALPGMRQQLLNRKGDVFVPGGLAGFDTVQNWITEKLISLRQQEYALYEYLGAHPGARQVYVDTSLLTSDSPVWPTPEKAAEDGKDFALRVAAGDLSDEDLDALNVYMNDPNFIAAFYNAAGIDWFTNATQTAYTKWQSVVMDPSSTPEQLSDALADYERTVNVLSSMLGLASQSSDEMSAKVALDISNVLYGAGDVLDPAGWPRRAAAAMSILVELASFSTSCAAEIAENIYQFDQEHGGLPYPAYPGNLNGTPVVGPTRPDGSSSGDIVQSIMTMLANNPDAATLFFANMTDKSDVTIDLDGISGGDDQTTVSISGHILWLFNRSWEDDGETAGRALATAGCPQPGQDRGINQSQVASQALIAATSFKQSDHDWHPQPGIGTGLAVIIAGNMDDLYISAPGTNSDGSVGATSTIPVDGKGYFTGDGMHLGVNSTIFGTVIQAIANDQNNTDIIMAGWADYMLEYLRIHVTAAPQTIDTRDPRVEFYLHPNSSRAEQALLNVGGVLDFIIDNALARLGDGVDSSSAESLLKSFAAAAVGIILAVTDAPVAVGVGASAAFLGLDVMDWWGGKAAAARAAAEQAAVGQDADAAADAMYGAYLQILAELGYFDPAIIEAYNYYHNDDHSNPPVTGTDGFDPNAGTADVEDWLDTTNVSDAKTKIRALQINDPHDNPSRAVSLPNEQ